ncbi:MAG: 2-dehydropantoate 2-reductase [Deltaproteobacteria bacterium]|nr:2-dehydropantoate 2-reductase [Deltaproteobacteria bacterium]
MNFLIVGPGAMGCLFAGHLKKAGHPVVILDYREDRARHINENGISLEGVGGKFKVQVDAVTQKKPSRKIHMALICVKAYQTDEVARTLSSWLDPDVGVLTLQNGLGNLEILQKVLGDKRVLGGVTAEGATLLGPGHVRHAGRGPTIIGPTGSDDGPVANIVSAFADAGFDIRAVDGVEDLIWGKLIVNVGINALAAITKLKNGQLPDIDGTRQVMKEAILEAVRVADAKGIKLPFPDPIERVLEVCRGTADNIASMLQDVLAQRATEIRFINGAIVSEGRRLGIPTPVNFTLSCLVEALQDSYNEAVRRTGTL